jgi:hypothetical protein
VNVASAGTLRSRPTLGESVLDRLAGNRVEEQCAVAACLPWRSNMFVSGPAIAGGRRSEGRAE